MLPCTLYQFFKPFDPTASAKGKNFNQFNKANANKSFDSSKNEGRNFDKYRKGGK